MKDPRYHLFGDTVNFAEAMESNGVPDRVHLSQACYSCLDDTFLRQVKVEPRIVDGVHGIEIEKRGRVVTYLVAENQGGDPVPQGLPSSAPENANASLDSFVMPQQPSRPMGQASTVAAGFGSDVALMKSEADGVALETEKLSWMEEQEKRIKEIQEETTK